MRAGEDRALAELADRARAARGPGDSPAPPGSPPTRLRLDFGWDLAPGGERAGGGGGAGDPPSPEFHVLFYDAQARGRRLFAPLLSNRH